jgi:excisionase family DNA binding protein
MTVDAEAGSEVVMLTTGEVARIFGVKSRAVRKWADAQLLTVHRTLGGHRRYDESEVLALAAKLRVPMRQAVA